MKKVILQGQAARYALKRGIDLVADCVKVTLGPSGRNAVLGRLDNIPTNTNDGVTIARNIEADDEIENMGVMMVKEAASLTDAKAGDGTTTTVVLLQALVDSLFKKLEDNGSLVKKRVDSIKLKKQLDALCGQVVGMLRSQAKPITKKDIYNVALVSAEYVWLARMIADIFEAVGVTGYVNIEEAVETGFDVFKGFRLKTGFASDYFYTNDRQQTVLDNPYIFVTNQKLEIQPVLNLVGTLPQDDVEQKRISLILVAPDFSLDLIKRMISTKMDFGLTIVPLKLETYGKDDLLVDIATLTEATFMDKNRFQTFEEFVDASNFGQLGKVEKAVIGVSDTVLLGGNGNTKKRVSDIKKIYDKTESEFDKNTLEQRMAHLSGGFATLRIGGESETERTYFKLKAEDAVNAVQEALKDGVVKGGGLALKNIADELGDTIISESLCAPYNQIQENSGGIKILDSVVDPVKITISAVKSACSLAGMVLTTEVAIAYKNASKDKDEN